MKIQKSDFPKHSNLYNSSYHYYDSFQSHLEDPNNTIDVLAVSKAFISSSPQWIESLFQLRNKIVSLFGLKTSLTKDKETVLKNFNGQPGEQLGFFKVFDRSENEIILGEDDKHLDFRVSLLLETVNSSTKNLIITTTVEFHNFFGKLYFLPVKPFHRIIVPVMLKGIIKQVNKSIKN
jgi:hypothetical protein